jgi:5-methylcytosine-specific restriction endonuclease McrA
VPTRARYQAQLVQDPSGTRAAYRAQNGRWRAEHPRYNADNTARYRAAFPDRVRESNRVTQGRRQEVIKAGERVERLVVLEAADGICAVCGEDVDPAHFELDHIIPLAEGGWHGYDNVQLAHPACNRTGRPRLSA